MLPHSNSRPLRVASNKHISIDNGGNSGFGGALSKSNGAIKRKTSLKKAVSMMKRVSHADK